MKVIDILKPENQEETILVIRTLFPIAEQANDLTVLLCAGLVESGGDWESVCSNIGVEMVRAKRHCQSRLANDIIREITKRKLMGEGYTIAVSSLISTASSEASTGTARNNASKTLLELCELESEKEGGDSSKDLSEMSLKELQAEVKQLKAGAIVLPPQKTQ